jgi:RNA polymerase sigma-70 factor (ECF subfamily)
VGYDELRDSDDRDLVAAIAGGDEDAFGEALRRHSGPVRAFAFRLAGDDGRAEEITQEVFLRLWQRPERFDRTRGSLRAFLLAQTHGRAVDVVRADSARRRREERDARRAAGSGGDVEHDVVTATVAAELRRALSRLAPAQREVVELAYFGERS